MDAGDEPEARTRGEISLRTRARSVGGDSDLDLHAVVSADHGRLAEDGWSAALLGSVALDVDGEGDRRDPFASLSDARGGALRGDLWHAFVDVAAGAEVERVRIGRQLDHETPELAWFDGVSARSRAFGSLGWTLGLYAGVPVHAYEGSPSGDRIGGAHVAAKPWDGGRARLDWMHVEDLYRGQAGEDDLWRISLAQHLGPRWLVETAFERLEERDRARELGLHWSAEDGRSALQVRYFEQLGTEARQVLEFDPFTQALQELRPYRELGVVATRALTEDVNLDLGLDLRRLATGVAAGTSNHEYERWFATLGWSEALPGRVDLALSGETWDADGAAVASWGIDLARAFPGHWEASLGSHFALWEYDAWIGDERVDVRTWSLRLRHRPPGGRRLDLRYEVQDDERAVWHTLRGGITWSF